MVGTIKEDYSRDKESKQDLYLSFQWKERKARDSRANLEGAAWDGKVCRGKKK